MGMQGSSPSDEQREEGQERKRRERGGKEEGEEGERRERGGKEEGGGRREEGGGRRERGGSTAADGEQVPKSKCFFFFVKEKRRE